MGDQDLIIIKQLPIITQKFRDMAVAVKAKTDYAMSLPCTAETKQEVKKLRADLNADKKDLEARRIAVKKAVLAPYDEMEAVYKTELLSLLIDTDKALQERIAVIEDAEKADKEENLRAYHVEYAASIGLSDVPYEAVGLNVTLTASEKALKEQDKRFLDTVADAYSAIGGMEHGAEVMAEYKANGYLFSNAVNAVNARYAAIEREKERMEAMKQHQAQVQEVVAKVDAVLAPIVQEYEGKQPDPAEIITVAFTVTASRAKLRALREYMKVEGLKYE